jgi:hypothetical protein
VHLYLHPAKLICPDHPISVITNYTAERTIILSNKEGGIDFAYEVTNECELSTRVLTDVNFCFIIAHKLTYSDTIGELFYYRDTNSQGGGSYPVFDDNFLEYIAQLMVENKLYQAQPKLMALEKTEWREHSVPCAINSPKF